QLRHHLVHMTDLADTIKDTQTRSFTPAPYATLAHRLARDTAQRVDLAGTHAHIRVEDPGHLAFARSIIGSRDIGARPDKIFLYQLGGIPPRDLLQLIRRVLLRIDADTALGAPEGYVHDRAFEGHQRGERHHLVEVHRRGKPDTAFTGGLVMRVLHPVGLD